MKGLVGGAIGIILLLTIFFLTSTFGVTFGFGLLGKRAGIALRPPGFTPQRVIMQYENSSKSTGFVVRASAGETIIVDYDLKIEKGWTMMTVRGPRSWFEAYLFPNPFAPPDDRIFGKLFGLEERYEPPGRGRIAVDVVEGGHYRVSVSPMRLTGSIDATVDVE